MKKLTALLLLISILSCTKETEKNNILYKSSDLELAYFPIQSGNLWIFENDKIRDSISFLNAQKFNDLEYLESNRRIVLNNSGNSFNYLRLSEDLSKVYAYYPELGNEYLFIDFSRDISENWEIKSATDSDYFYRAEITRKNFNHSLNGKDYENCIEVKFYIPGIADEEFLYIFSQGYGIIEWQNEHLPNFKLIDLKLE